MNLTFNESFFGKLKVTSFRIAVRPRDTSLTYSLRKVDRPMAASYLHCVIFSLYDPFLLECADGVQSSDGHDFGYNFLFGKFREYVNLFPHRFTSLRIIIFLVVLPVPPLRYAVNQGLAFWVLLRFLNFLPPPLFFFFVYFLSTWVFPVILVPAGILLFRIDLSKVLHLFPPLGTRPSCPLYCLATNCLHIYFRAGLFTCVYFRYLRTFFTGVIGGSHFFAIFSF